MMKKKVLALGIVLSGMLICGISQVSADTTRTVACTGLPNNAVWSSNSSTTKYITQTWLVFQNTGLWVPSSEGSYNTSTLGSNCYYTCNATSTRNSSNETCVQNTREAGNRGRCIQGQTTRTVQCTSFAGAVLADAACDVSTKPSTTQTCTVPLPIVEFSPNGSTTYKTGYAVRMSVDGNDGRSPKDLKYIWQTSSNCPSTTGGYTSTFTENGTIYSPANQNGQVYLCVTASNQAGGTIYTGRSFLLDTIAPSGNTSISGNITHTTQNSVKIKVSSVSDNISANNQIVGCVSKNTSLEYCGFWSSLSNLTWELSEGYGDKMGFVFLRDQAGNVSSPKLITINRVAPSEVTFSPNGNDNTPAKSASITVTVTVNDKLDNSSTLKYTWMKGACPLTTASYTETLTNNQVITTPENGHGGYRLCVMVTNPLVPSEPVIKGSNYFVLDNTAPTGSIKINNGATTTTSRYVTLNLSGIDTTVSCGWEPGLTSMVEVCSGTSKEAYQMCISNQSFSATFCPTQWENYATIKSNRDLTAGIGEKWVYVRYKDQAGNISQEYKAKIELQAVIGTYKIILSTGTINSGTYTTTSESQTRTLTPPTNFLTVSFDSNGGGTVTPASVNSEREFSGWIITTNSTPSSSIVGNTLTIPANAAGPIIINDQWKAWQSVTCSPAPKKEGFYFLGRYTSPINGEGTRKCGANGSYTPTSSETLYAHWEALPTCNYQGEVTPLTQALFNRLYPKNSLCNPSTSLKEGPTYTPGAGWRWTCGTVSHPYEVSCFIPELTQEEGKLRVTKTAAPREARPGEIISWKLVFTATDGNINEPESFTDVIPEGLLLIPGFSKITPEGSAEISIEGDQQLNITILPSLKNGQSITVWIYTKIPEEYEENKTITNCVKKAELQRELTCDDDIQWNGLLIAACNVGATEVSNGNNPASFGNYYQWGNNNPMGDYTVDQYQPVRNTSINARDYLPSQYTSSEFITVNPRDYPENPDLRGDKTNTNEARKGPCPEGYHVPSLSEWETLFKGMSNADTNVLVETLKFPYGGRRDGNTARLVDLNQGNRGGYRSSTPFSAMLERSHMIKLSPSEFTIEPYNRNEGLNVRCFKDTLPEAIENTLDEPVCDTVNIVPKGELEREKTASTSRVTQVGDEIIYTLKFTGTGGKTEAGWFSDEINENLEVIETGVNAYPEERSNNVKLNQQANNFDIYIPSLNNGETITIVIKTKLRTLPNTEVVTGIQNCLIKQSATSYGLLTDGGLYTLDLAINPSIDGIAIDPSIDGNNVINSAESNGGDTAENPIEVLNPYADAIVQPGDEDSKVKCVRVSFPENIRNTTYSKKLIYQSGDTIAREITWQGVKGVSREEQFIDELTGEITNISIGTAKRTQSPAGELSRSSTYPITSPITFTLSGLQEKHSVSLIITGTILPEADTKNIENCIYKVDKTEESENNRFGTEVPLVGIHYEDWIDRDRNDAELCFYGEKEGNLTFNGQEMTAQFSGELNLEIQRNAGANHDYKITVKNSKGRIKQIYTGNTYHGAPIKDGSKKSISYKTISVSTGDNIEVSFVNAYWDQYGGGEACAPEGHPKTARQRILNNSQRGKRRSPNLIEKKYSCEEIDQGRLEVLPNKCRNLFAKKECAGGCSKGEFRNPETQKCEKDPNLFCTDGSLKADKKAECEAEGGERQNADCTCTKGTISQPIACGSLSGSMLPWDFDIETVTENQFCIPPEAWDGTSEETPDDEGGVIITWKCKNGTEELICSAIKEPKQEDLCPDGKTKTEKKAECEEKGQKRDGECDCIITESIETPVVCGPLSGQEIAHDIDINTLDESQFCIPPEALVRPFEKNTDDELIWKCKNDTEELICKATKVHGSAEDLCPDGTTKASHEAEKAECLEKNGKWDDANCGCRNEPELVVCGDTYHMQSLPKNTVFDSTLLCNPSESYNGDLKETTNGWTWSCGDAEACWASNCPAGFERDKDGNCALSDISHTKTLSGSREISEIGQTVTWIFTWTANAKFQDKNYHYIEELPSYFEIVGDVVFKPADAVGDKVTYEIGEGNIDFRVHNMNAGEKLTVEVTVKLVERPEGVKGFRNCLVASGNGEDASFDKKVGLIYEDWTDRDRIDVSLCLEGDVTLSSEAIVANFAGILPITIWRGGAATHDLVIKKNGNQIPAQEIRLVSVDHSVGGGEIFNAENPTNGIFNINDVRNQNSLATRPGVDAWLGLNKELTRPFPYPGGISEEIIEIEVHTGDAITVDIPEAYAKAYGTLASQRKSDFREQSKFLGARRKQLQDQCVNITKGEKREQAFCQSVCFGEGCEPCPPGEACSLEVNAIKTAKTAGPVAIGDTVEREITFKAGLRGGNATDFEDILDPYLELEPRRTQEEGGPWRIFSPLLQLEGKIMCNSQDKIEVTYKEGSEPRHIVFSVKELGPNEEVTCSFKTKITDKPADGVVKNCITSDQCEEVPFDEEHPCSDGLTRNPVNNACEPLIPEGWDVKYKKVESERSENTITWDLTREAYSDTENLTYRDIIPAEMTDVVVTIPEEFSDILTYNINGTDITFSISRLTKGQTISAKLQATIAQGSHPTEVQNCLSPANIQRKTTKESGLEPLVGVHIEDDCLTASACKDRDRNDAAIYFFGQPGALSFNGSRIISHTEGELLVEILRSSAAIHEYEIMVRDENNNFKTSYPGSTLGNGQICDDCENAVEYKAISVEPGDQIEVHFTKFKGSIYGVGMELPAYPLVAVQRGERENIQVLSNEYRNIFTEARCVTSEGDLNHGDIEYSKTALEMDPEGLITWEVRFEAVGGDVIQQQSFFDTLSEGLTVVGEPEIKEGNADKIVRAITNDDQIKFTLNPMIASGEAIVLQVQTQRDLNTPEEEVKNCIARQAELLILGGIETEVGEKCVPIPACENCTVGKLTSTKIAQTDTTMISKGQRIDWLISVKAEGGDVNLSNYSIQDRRSENLTVVSRESEGTPVEVNITTTFDQNPLKRSLNGKLLSGEEIKIKVITVVNEQLQEESNSELCNEQESKNINQIKNELCVEKEDAECNRILSCIAPYVPNEEGTACVCEKVACTNGAINYPECDDCGPWADMDENGQCVPKESLTIKKTFIDGTKEKLVKIDDQVGYKVTFQNNTDQEIAGITIRDILPTNLEYVSSELYLENEKTQLQPQMGEGKAERTNLVLPAKSSGYLLLTGTVQATNPESRMNMACIENPEIGKSACDSVIYDRDTYLTIEKTIKVGSEDLKETTKNKEEKAEFTIKIENLGKNPANGFTLTDALPEGLEFVSITNEEDFATSEKGQSTTLTNAIRSISAGGSREFTLIATVVHAGERTNKACVFHENPKETCDTAKVSVTETEFLTICANGATNYPICNKCPEGAELINNVCVTEQFVCGNGEREVQEHCDCLTTGAMSCSALDAQMPTEYQKYKSDKYVCNKCRLVVNPENSEGDTSNKETPPLPSCLGMGAANGGFSVNLGEIMPFYRYMPRVGGEGYTNEKVTLGSSCTTTGQISTPSMKCNFIVTINGKLDNPVYKIKDVDCFSASENIAPLLENFLKQNQNLYLDRGTSVFKSALYALKNFGLGGKNASIEPNQGSATFNGINNTLGEYKIALEEINYYQCSGATMTWQQGAGLENWCETPFAVTDTYVVQKTPAGNLKETEGKLQKYYSALENKNFDEILTAVLTPGNNEHGAANDEMERAIFNFKNTYQRLAINTSANKLFSTAGTVKRLPNQNIWFVTDAAIFITGENITAPTTIIADKDVTIYGNVKQNLMVITNGIITFKAADCNSSQIIKGIFYANGFDSSEAQRNDNLNNATRCNKGNLVIQGMAIEKTQEVTEQSKTLLKKVAPLRRSYLNEWFNCPDATNTTQCLQHRQNLIMNGASLLIEYSPSIFAAATRSPGVEDFTDALSVYRQ